MWRGDGNKLLISLRKQIFCVAWEGWGSGKEGERLRVELIVLKKEKRLTVSSEICVCD